MTTLHVYFALRNQQAFQRLLDASSRAQTTPAPALSSSGGKSWSRPSPLSSSSAAPPCDVNARDWLGRTVLHLAVSSPDPAALEYVRLLLAHSRIDPNLADTESRWTPLHRALYAGNLAACVLLLQRSDVDTSLKDLEGYTAFDLYNSTVEGTKPGAGRVADLFTWGVNRNAALGLDDGDDRAFPDHVVIQPQKDHPEPETQTLAERFDPICVVQVSMSKLHTVIVTTETKGNLRLCGFGSGGRLGPGQHTQYSLVPLGQLQHAVTAVALGQDHTLALTSSGDVLSWGLNRFAQLGYVIEPASSGLAARSALSGDEQIQAVPRRVYGPLKKEVVRGVAACKTASACWTDEEVFTWGTNSGQLGYDKNAQSTQILPRKVTSIAQPIIDMAITDSAMACLLKSKDVLCFWSGRNFKINFPTQSFPSEIQAYRPPMAQSNANIAKVVSCENTFAALSSNGEMFTFTLNPPSAAPDTGPQSKSGMVVKPQRVWALRKQFSAVKDVALGADGSIVLCTESGHVYVRSRNVKGGQIAGAKTFRFQRIPFLQRVVSVTANSTGAFGALRVDCTPMAINIVGNLVAQDLATIQPFLCYSQRDDEVETLPNSLTSPTSEVADADEEVDDLSVRDDVRAVARLCELLIRDKESHRKEGHGFFDEESVRHGADLIVQVASFEFAAHRVILAARSTVLCDVLRGRIVKQGQVSIRAITSASGHSGLPHLIFVGFHPLTILLLMTYVYSDESLAIWDRRVGLAVDSYLTALKISPTHIRSELQTLTKLLDLTPLLLVLDSPAKRAPAPLVGRHMQALFDVAQDLAKGSIVAVATDPLAPDTILELSDKLVFCHSTILRARSPFFASFFGDKDWTAKRWRPDYTVHVNLKHMKWRIFYFVIRHIYSGEDEEMFERLEFTRNIDDVLELMFEIMAIASELLLDRLSLACSAIILKHVNISNVCSILSDARYFHAEQLVASLQGYIARSMETLLESRMLDDLPNHLIRELSQFVRSRQAQKLPLTRSNKLIEKALERHAGWLEMQDIPQPVVRSSVKGPLRKSPKLSPVAMGKRNQRTSTGQLSPSLGPQTEPRSMPPLVQSNVSGVGDEIFVMDDDARDDIPPLVLPSAQTGPTLDSNQTSLSVPAAGNYSPWKARVSKLPSKVDLKSIMAEAEEQRGIPSPSVTPPSRPRVVGFDTRGFDSPPSRPSAKANLPSDVARNKAASPWRMPPSPVPTKTSLVPVSNSVRTDTPQNTPPSGISRVLKDSPGAGPSRVLASPQTPLAAKGKVPLGPTFAPIKQPIHVAAPMTRRTSEGVNSAWTAVPVQHCPEPGPSSSPPSFLAIQQQQRDQGLAPTREKKSLREIQEEEQAKQAEEEFMKWWAEEEERIRLQTQPPVLQPDNGGKKSKGSRRKPPFKGAMNSSQTRDQSTDGLKPSASKRAKGRSSRRDKESV